MARLLTKARRERRCKQRLYAPGHSRVIEMRAQYLYNFGRTCLPDSASNPAPAPKPHNWTLVAAGLLLLALAVVVIYTSRTAFSSPLALVVVTAIGLAALMLQLRLRKDLITGVRVPLRINLIGIVLAIAAVVADIFHFSAHLMLITALGSVFCFAISGTLILHALRKPRP
jgi:hypothetical protein